MNTQRDPDAILAAWLEDGPARLPDGTRRAIGVATRSTDQRRRPVWAAWRLPHMNSYARLAAAAVVVVAVGAVGVALLHPAGSSTPGGVVLPSATPSAAPSPVATPSAAVLTPSATPPDTSAWVPFTSTRYGYTISHPPSWSATPADHDATISASPTDVPDSSTDHFIDESASYGILVTGFAETVQGPVTVDDWLNSYYKASTPEQQRCYSTIEIQPITIDGHVGKIASNDPCSATEAFVLVGRRIYGFGVWRENQGALLRAFLGTVHFPAAAPSPAATPVAFSSDLYGYRVSLPAGWSAAPARVRWDGNGAPPYDDPQVDRFSATPSLSAFAFAAPTRLALNAFANDVIARTAQFHGDTCPDPPTSVESITVGGAAAKFIAFNCGILINIVVVVHNGTGYEFVMRDTGVSAATDANDRAAFDRILASVKFGS